jgi:hypothetical protein
MFFIPPAARLIPVFLDVSLQPLVAFFKISKDLLHLTSATELDLEISTGFDYEVLVNRHDITF